VQGGKALGTPAEAEVARARHVAEVVLAAEDLGTSARCLEMAVDYAKQRVAFGRPIGSFQAIKHMCVDMFAQVEQLRSLVWYAAWCADHDLAQLPMAASAAKAYASGAVELCGSTCVQVHGGIGFTWEHDAHLYWRRAKVDRVLLGDAARHHARVAELALARA
jgi:alkylation response protein AidB-like acyl-CoA dehydrogenase